MPPNETVLYRIEAPSTAHDWLVAELSELGTLGIEERPDGELRAWFPVDAVSSREILALADPARRIRVQGPLPVPEVDWEIAWREGLAPRRVGPLWIRPSWCESAGEPEIRIDPQRAFGTGEHPSTRLALARLLAELRDGDRVLDVGTGTGILAIAALRMGAGSAVGIDPDPDACENARENVRENAAGKQGSIRLLRGTLAAIDPNAEFDLAVANLLLSRLEPWLGRVLGHTRRAAVLSGYLRSEANRLETALARADWRIRETAEEVSPYDADGNESWCACVVVPER